MEIVKFRATPRQVNRVKRAFWALASIDDIMAPT